jgi:hypothetical protein
LFIGAIAAAAGKWAWDEYIKPEPIYVHIKVHDDLRPPHDLANVYVVLESLNDKEQLNGVKEQPTGHFGQVTFAVARKYRNKVVVPKFSLQDYALLPSSNNKIALAAPEVSGDYVLSKVNFVRDEKPYTAGPYPSGEANNPGKWYELCNSPEPEGWTIEKSEFILTGDRTCGSWAECNKTTDTPTKVCYQFRMQGHSEQVGGLFNRNTGVQYSSGNLKVTWKH